MYLVVLVAALATQVWAINRPDWEPTAISAVRGDAGSTRLEVDVQHSRCPHGGPRVDVEEAGDVVVLRARQDRQGDCDDIGLTTTIDVELRQPLDDRRIDPGTHREGIRCDIDGAPDACQPLEPRQ